MIDPQPLAAGDEGELVTELQRRLHFLNYYAGDITGRYDDSTTTAVQEFQDAWGLTKDGAMSLDGWTKLEEAATQAGFYEPDDDVGGAVAEDGGLAPGTLSEDGQYQWNGTDWQAVGGDSGDTAGELLSEDGQYRWDGANWVPVSGEQPADTAGDTTGGTASEILSEDGQYRWDGANWIPVSGEQPADQPADKPAEKAADESPELAAAVARTKVLTEDEFGKMVSESISVSDSTA